MKDRGTWLRSHSPQESVELTGLLAFPEAEGWDKIIVQAVSRESVQASGGRDSTQKPFLELCQG